MLVLGFTQVVWISLLMLFSSFAHAGLTQVTVNTYDQTSPHEWSFIPGKGDAQERQSQEDLAALGFSVSLDSQGKTLKVLAYVPSTTSDAKPMTLKLVTEFPVELEGKSEHSLIVVSRGAQVTQRWSSPSLSLRPTGDTPKDQATYQVSPGADLEVQELNLFSGGLINGGKILSPKELNIIIQDGTCENQGVIESQSTLRLQGGRGDQKPHFLNLGRVAAPQIEVGSYFRPFYSFQNGNPKNGIVHAKKWDGYIELFSNSGEFLAAEAVSLSGSQLNNERGSLHSGGFFYADFFEVNNFRGSISGQRRTELKVRKTIANEEGEIGSLSPTELNLLGVDRTKVLGKIQGSDLAIHSDHQTSVSLQKGELYAQNSISIFSQAKILLPGVQVHAPHLHLAVPDFALDQQKDCDTTLIHCDPKRGFTLTSPYCTEGNVVFLQSCLKRESFKPAASQSVPGSVRADASRVQHQDDLALNPDHDLKQRLTELRDEVSQMSVHFERRAGTIHAFKVSLLADLKSSQDVEFVAPLANVYFGDVESRPAIEAQSLRSWANFVLLGSGHVAARDAAIIAPGGLRIGKLTEYLHEGVKVTDQTFPLMGRDGAIWATQNQTLLQGPLACDGTMEVGGDLILRSEKDQFSFSPEIHVKGDLVFQGSGEFNAIRYLGDSLHLSTSSLPSSEYSVPGKIQVDQTLVSEKPMTLNLFSTDLVADQVTGDLGLRQKGSQVDREIQFPGADPSKNFGSNVCTRKGAVLKLEGRNHHGVIAAPQLFLVEKRGEFVLATKNPYYINPKSPIQDLMQKGFEFSSVHITPDLKKAMQQAAEYRFHYSLRERFFFNHSEGERFYEEIKDHIVILQPGHGLVPLPAGKAVFSLSPGLLLQRVKDLTRENLMRGYIYEDRPITLWFVAELHRNAIEYLASQGVPLAAGSGSIHESGQNILVALQNPQDRARIPQKPLIFYQQFLNEQGVEELKPILYLPPTFLEQARAQQTGNTFATVLASFPEGTTSEEMLECLPEESGVKKALVEYFKNNPKTKEAVTQAAERAQLTETALEDSLSLSVLIQAEHFAVITEGDLHLEGNQKGKTAAFVSKKGSISLGSHKRKHQSGSSFEEKISDQRALTYEGHLELRAGKDIQTQAVKINVGSLQIDAHGHVIDSALMLDSHSESEAPGISEARDRTDAHVSHFKTQGKLGVKAQNIALMGTQAAAGSIRMDAKDQIAVLGVQESTHLTKRTEEETGALFWKGKKVQTQAESSIQFKAASLKAKDTLEMEAHEATLQASLVEARETEIQAEQLRILQGKNTSASSSSSKSESAFWISMDSKQEKHHSHTQAAFQGKVKIKVKELELEQVRDQVLTYLDHLDYDPAQVEVVHKLLEEIHHREEKTISAPGPALIAAVAVISSIATAGAGGAAVAGLGMKAASVIGTATSATISSITAQVATQITLGVLSQQSLGDIVTQITRPETFKNAAVSALTAGALFEVHGLQEAAGTSDVLRKIENAGVQSSIGLGVNLACGEQSFGDALKCAGVQFASQSVSSAIATEIGSFYAKSEGTLARGLHKVAHGVSAAVVGGSGAALLGQDIGTAAAGAAAGAMTAEVVAEILAAPLTQEVVDEVKKQHDALGRPLTVAETKAIFDSKLHDITQISELTGALSGLLTGDSRGVSAAGASSSTALHNNYLAVAAPLLWVATEAALTELATVTAGVASAAVGGYALHKASEFGDAGEAEGEHVDLTSTQGRKHILYGDAPTKGGGHRAGTGKPGKSEFPKDWSDDKILHEVSDVATDPHASIRPGGYGTEFRTGVRDGVEVETITDGNKIITGYPTNLPRNPQ